MLVNDCYLFAGVTGHYGATGRRLARVTTVLVHRRITQLWYISTVSVPSCVHITFRSRNNERERAREKESYLKDSVLIYCDNYVQFCVFRGFIMKALKTQSSTVKCKFTLKFSTLLFKRNKVICVTFCLSTLGVITLMNVF